MYVASSTDPSELSSMSTDSLTRENTPCAPRRGPRFPADVEWWLTDMERRAVNVPAQPDDLDEAQLDDDDLDHSWVKMPLITAGCC